MAEVVTVAPRAPGKELALLRRVNPSPECRSWLQDTVKRKLVDFAWNRRFFLFTRRVLAFFRVNPAKSVNQPDFFYPERLF